VILSTQQKNTICYSTIPSVFKEKYGYISSVEIKEIGVKRRIEFKNEILILYLIYLKSNSKEEWLKNWFERLSNLYIFLVLMSSFKLKTMTFLSPTKHSLIPWNIL